MTKTPSLINDCFLHDKDRLRHDEALTLLRERVGCIAGMETIDLKRSAGRILAETVLAPHPVPLHTNSAVDGYAFLHADLGSGTLPLSQKIAAGDLDPSPLQKGTAARIFTGAPMPPNADSVAMQEDCVEDGASVTLPLRLKAGANCRGAGEDLQTGDIIVSKGTRLNAIDIAALTSIGLTSISVRTRLRVTLISNGNEMRRPGDGNGPLRPGEVWDANAPLLANLLAKLPFDVIDGGIVSDDPADARAAIEIAAKNSDVIITTGGASRGQEDHMLTTLDQLGERHMWQLAIKPGRPMMFGQVHRTGERGDCIFLGLPGNPVAAMVCFLLYARPTLLQLCGADWTVPQRFPVSAGFTIENKKPDRREFLRGILRNEDGRLYIDKYPRDGSGLISSLREADGLIEIPEEVIAVSKGDLVRFIPFASFD